MSRTNTARERHLAASLTGRGNSSRRPGLSNVLFRPITLISLILIGFFAFGALIVLGGFAKDLRKAPPGQATPRSVSAVGYQALTDYLEKLNYDVRETRGKRDYYDREERLVIYTPSRPTWRLSKTLENEGDAVNFIILPKWSVGQMIAQPGEDARKGWARKTRGTGLYYPSAYENMMDGLPVLRRLAKPSPDAELIFNTSSARNSFGTYQPDFIDLQYFDLESRWPAYLEELREAERKKAEERRRQDAEARGETYEPRKKKEKKKKESDETKPKEENVTPEPLPKHKVMLKIDGKAVLIQLEDTQTYILSEPDLINTMAFKTQSGAAFTHAIIDEIIFDANAISMSADFDVSLHGIETNRNIIKLMVTPPFLAATLCLLAAGGLIAWQGFNRFGDPARQRPDYAHGPVSLAQTAADFMGIADRAHKTGEDYADLIRRQVVKELGYKDRTTKFTDTLLDTREKRLKIQPEFADLKRAIAGADPQSYGQYARALTLWRDAMTRPDYPQGPQNS